MSVREKFEQWVNGRWTFDRPAAWEAWQAARADAAREAAPFLQHRWNCASITPPNFSVCNCGLKELLEAQAKAKAGDS
jgi:hypothetical protein